mgnify:CR=1 FL=1
MTHKNWQGFTPGVWQDEINVRDFIQKNYTPYEGDSSFLVESTNKTKKLWEEVLNLYKKEADNIRENTNELLATAIKRVDQINKERERQIKEMGTKASTNADEETVSN